MNINVSRGFVTELLKDLVYPEICPICGDIIPTSKRIAYHRASTAVPRPVKAVTGRLTASMKTSHNSQYPLNDICKYPYKARFNTEQVEEFYSKLPPEFYQGLGCSSCLNKLDYIKAPYCRKCGKPLSVGADTELLCSDCRTHERSFIQNRALLCYDECMRDIMIDIKYNGRKEYLKLFGALAADRLGAWIQCLDASCLIPVPIHASRLMKRGYNQSELLCRYISDLIHVPVRNDIIIRNKKTAAQKELNADERLLNLQSAFKTAGRLPSESIALIVDDIYTTGSTLEACTERIMEAGAARVYGLTICIGEDKGRK